MLCLDTGADKDEAFAPYAGSDAFHKAQIYQKDGGDWEIQKHNIILQNKNYFQSREKRA